MYDEGGGVKSSHELVARSQRSDMGREVDTGSSLGPGMLDETPPTSKAFPLGSAVNVVYVQARGSVVPFIAGSDHNPHALSSYINAEDEDEDEDVDEDGERG